MLLKQLSSVRRRLRDASVLLARHVAYVNPDVLTILGMFFSAVAPVVAYSTRNPLAVAAISSLAMLMDALDGSVARLRGESTKYGAFLDSLADRFSDALIVLALYPLGCDYLLVYLVATLSMTISYIRARAESLGVKGLAEVGLMTREFRSLGILLIYPVLYLFGTRVADYSLLALLVVLCFTAVQRSMYVIRSLKRDCGRISSI